MRRLLIILLLTLLPLQASWAVVCAYCPDNCTSESAGAADPQAGAADQNGLDNDDECGRCHLGGAGLASSLAATCLFPHPATLAAPHASVLPALAQADRPERPNWMRAA